MDFFSGEKQAMLGRGKMYGLVRPSHCDGLVTVPSPTWVGDWATLGLQSMVLHVCSASFSERRADTRHPRDSSPAPGLPPSASRAGGQRNPERTNTAQAHGN